MLCFERFLRRKTFIAKPSRDLLESPPPDRLAGFVEQYTKWVRAFFCHECGWGSMIRKHVCPQCGSEKRAEADVGKLKIVAGHIIGLPYPRHDGPKADWIRKPKNNHGSLKMQRDESPGHYFRCPVCKRSSELINENFNDGVFYHCEVHGRWQNYFYNHGMES